VDWTWQLDPWVPLVLWCGTTGGVVTGFALWIAGVVWLFRHRAARSGLKLGLGLSASLEMAGFRSLGTGVVSWTLLSSVLAAGVVAVVVARRRLARPAAGDATLAGALLVWDGLYLSHGGWTMLALLVAFFARMAAVGWRGMRRDWAGARAQAAAALLWVAVGVAVIGFSRFNLKLSENRSREVVAACGRFEAERGHLPATLEDLVPGYLPRVPRADWTAAGEFHYSPAEGGVLSYFGPWPRLRVYAFKAGSWAWRQFSPTDPVRMRSFHNVSRGLQALAADSHASSCIVARIRPVAPSLQ